MADEKILEIIIRAKDMASKTLKQVNTELETSQSRWKALGQAMTKAGAIITGVSGAMAVALEKTMDYWDETRRAQVALEQAFSHMPQLVNENIQAWYQWVAAEEEKLAVDDAVLNRMGVYLTTLGLNVKQMQQLIPLIVDLSRKYQIDYMTATKAVVRAIQGETFMLERYGIMLDVSAAKTEHGIDTTKSYQLVIDQLSTAVGGYTDILSREGILANERFQITFDNLKETIGQVVTTAVKPMLETLSRWLYVLQETNNALVVNAAKIAVVGTALGLITGPLMMVIGNLGKLLALVKGIINPWTTLIAVVISLTTYLYQTNDAFREFVNTLLGKVMEGISYVADNFGIIADVITNTLQRVKQAVETILQPVIVFMEQLFGQVVSWTQENWPLIQQTIQTVMNAIQTVISTVLQNIHTFWDLYGQQIMQITQAIWEGIKTIIETLLNTILGLIKAIMQAINGDWSGAWETIKQTLGNAWNAMVQMLKNLLPKIISAVKEIIATIWQQFKDFLPKMQEMGEWIINRIIMGFKAMIQAIINAAKDIAKAIANVFINLAKEAFEWGKNLIKMFIEGIKSKVHDLFGWVESIAEKIHNTLGIHSPAKEGPLSDADKWMPNLINMFAEQLREGARKLQPAVQQVAETLSATATIGIQAAAQEPVITGATSTVGATQTTARVETGDIANAVYIAVKSALQDLRLEAPTASGEGNIVLEIDGQVFARAIYDYLLTESQRRTVGVVPT